MKTNTLFILSIIAAFLGILVLHFALGIQFAASVALSDFCLDPATFIEQQRIKNLLNQNFNLYFKI